MRFRHWTINWPLLNKNWKLQKRKKKIIRILLTKRSENTSYQFVCANISAIVMSKHVTCHFNTLWNWTRMRIWLLLWHMPANIKSFVKLHFLTKIFCDKCFNNDIEILKYTRDCLPWCNKISNGNACKSRYVHLTFEFFFKVWLSE